MTLVYGPVKKQAYHSQCFIANHFQTILKESDILLNVLDGLPDQASFKQLFPQLCYIFSFTEAKFLTPSKKDHVLDVLYEKKQQLKTWIG